MYVSALDRDERDEMYERWSMRDDREEIREREGEREGVPALKCLFLFTVRFANNHNIHMGSRLHFLSCIFILFFM